MMSKPDVYPRSGFRTSPLTPAKVTVVKLAPLVAAEVNIRVIPSNPPIAVLLFKKFITSFRR
jgi:hypothetical protein